MSLKEYLFGFACEDRAAEFLRSEGFEILKTVEDGSTEFTVKNLENLKQHSFGIEGFDDKNERVLRKWIYVTPGSQI